MLKCQVCGYDNPDSATVCLNCGSTIDRQVVSEAIDDISGEATILLGGPPKVPSPPPERPKQDPPKAGGFPPPPPPPPEPAAPKPAAQRFGAPPPPASSGAGAPPPPPPPPQPSGGGLPITVPQSSGTPSELIMAIVGIVLGAVSIVLSCCWYLTIPAAIAAIVLGFLAMKKPEQKTLGIVSIVLGAIGILISLIFAVLAVVGTTLGG